MRRCSANRNFFQDFVDLAPYAWFHLTADQSPFTQDVEGVLVPEEDTQAGRIYCQRCTGLPLRVSSAPLLSNWRKDRRQLPAFDCTAQGGTHHMCGLNTTRLKRCFLSFECVDPDVDLPGRAQSARRYGSSQAGMRIRAFRGDLVRRHGTFRRTFRLVPISANVSDWGACLCCCDLCLIFLPGNLTVTLLQGGGVGWVGPSDGRDLLG